MQRALPHSPAHCTCHWWSDCRCAGNAGGFVRPPTPSAALTRTWQHHEMARAKPGTKAGASCTMPAGLHGACPTHSPQCYWRYTAAGLKERGGEASSPGFCPIKPFRDLADWYSEVYMIYSPFGSPSPQRASFTSLCPTEGAGQWQLAPWKRLHPNRDHAPKTFKLRELSVAEPSLIFCIYLAFGSSHRL